MVAYFVRRLVGGVLLFCVAIALSFALVVELPGGPRDLIPPSKDQVTPPHPWPDDLWARLNYADKPWPQNYLNWLYDGEAPYIGYLIDSREDWVETYNQSRQWKVHTRPSGLMVGHFGYSNLWSEGYVIAVDTGSWLLHVSTLALTFGLVVKATLQRRRRTLHPRTTLPPDIYNANPFLKHLSVWAVN